MATSSNLSSVTAVILAGGLGTRLRPVVEDRPKVLAEIDGRPFMSFLLEQLDNSGIRQTVLCTGYLGEQIQETLGDTYRGISLTYSSESIPLGTAGALQLALPLIKSDVALIMNGDSICKADLRAFWDWHCRHNAPGSLVLTQVPDSSRYGQVILADDHRVQGFSEKSANSGAGWVNAGIYLLGKGLLRTIPAGKTVSLEQEMFPVWLTKGLYGYKSSGEFIDIGTPESYSQADRFFSL